MQQLKSLLFEPKWRKTTHEVRMNEHKSSEKPKFNAEKLKSARQALKKGSPTTALNFLGNIENGEGFEVVERLRTLHLRSEIQYAIGTPISLAEAKADCLRALRDTKDLPRELQHVYEAAFICTSAEIERVSSGTINLDLKEALLVLTQTLPEGHTKDVLTYYSHRTLALAGFPADKIVQEHLGLAKNSYTRNHENARLSSDPHFPAIPRDGVMESANLNNIKIEIIRGLNPNPLSNFYELPTTV